MKNSLTLSILQFHLSPALTFLFPFRPPSPLSYSLLLSLTPLPTSRLSLPFQLGEERHAAETLRQALKSAEDRLARMAEGGHTSSPAYSRAGERERERK